MSIEEALAANTAALIENTKAHAKLAEVAMAAAGGKASASTAEKAKVTETEEEEAPKETAAEKKKRLAAEKAAATKKAAAEKAKASKAKKPELVSEMTAAELHKIAAAFMSDELDEAERDANKANFVGGLAHLGAKKFSELSDDTERARLAAYIGYWQAGLDVDFEEIDGLIEALDGGEEDDDPMA
ncbi:hypothetical protein ACM25O_13370 [Sulfitobacter pontiacus]